MKKKYYIVYRTDNLVNGKYYHGCHAADNLEDGYIGSGTAFSRAVTKYGKEAFERTILGFYDSREAMIEAEKEAVNHKDPMSYNMMPGGAYVTDEGCKKIADANSTRTISPETRKKLGDIRRGKPVSPETRKKISDACKGRTLSAEHKRKLLDANIGRTMSPETRKKIGDAHRGKTLSDEHQRTLIDANTGKTHSPEHCKNIADGNRGKTRSPETCKNISESLRGKKKSPESIRKRRISFMATLERKKMEKLRDELPDQTGSFHFSYGDELGDDFLTLDTSLKSHLDDNATYKSPPPVPMKLARGTIT